MNIQDELTIPERLGAPTPRLFKTVRVIGITVAAVAGALIGVKAQGIALPAGIEFFAQKAYILAGAVAALVSQLTVDVKAYQKANALR
ncbi:hypothetical protein [uncultured Fibrella sp.]|uniref:hypothetical protein n=1 Tax=uncultured Fibrella sp. TaxID=1284596 RepID=UPI0035C9D661